MLDVDLTRLLLGKGSRPLSVSLVISAIFLPSSLLVFLTRPDIYHDYGLVGGIFFGAVIGFPVLIALSLPWFAGLNAALKAESLTERTRLAVAGEVLEKPTRPIAESVNDENPFEWPVIIIGAWFANLVLYGLCVLAFYRPIRLGATLLLTGSIALIIWLLVGIALELRLAHMEKPIKKLEGLIRLKNATSIKSPATE